MNTQTNAEVQHYLDRMREALADLPATEVGEIMDDAGAHVVEVAEEMGEEFSLAALTDRLGTPHAYAQELRAAAGYPSPAAVDVPTGSRPTILARFALWSLVAGTVMAFASGMSGGDSEELTLLIGLCAVAATVLVFRQSALMPEIERLPETAALTDGLRRLEQGDTQRVLASLRTFQPVWWLGRALLIGSVALMSYRYEPAALLVLALGVLSLVAGPKARTDRRWLWISLPATGAALGVLLLILGSLASQLDAPSPVQASYNPQPSTPDNIYVFDKDGKPLTDVHLYDENGQPLETPWYGCDGRSSGEDNRYPRPRVVHDENGCREIPGVPPFAIVLPTPNLTTTVPPASTVPSGSAAPTTPPSTPTPSAQAPAPTTVTPVTPTG
ncbi:hypothetical protein ALI22I_26910 [Saccharothrix sp. ALI-22-I]|uniref:HAAS signaling domain-containing protein n=1 Tax=Saccharothrix sp. ALI-22-I TaxID=1933778 RepID=UPI00097C9F16|nr:hypothetical protein [Saccharothrix sp. ALI-22-I]ONI85443.1 hypothetical protein ALI22I_26910 [Saccharothrix sp. ALI-22-I]